jgi:hypothetical protein
MASNVIPRQQAQRESSAQVIHGCTPYVLELREDQVLTLQSPVRDDIVN